MRYNKLGTYLIEEHSCDQAAVERGLSVQASLARQGKSKPLGQVLVEDGLLDQHGLEQALRHQRADILAAAEIFQSLSAAAVTKIASVAEVSTLEAAEIIFRQGDPGNSFCLILEGRVRIFNVSEDGREITLAELGPGDGFGEMALLTGEPRSASVQTLGQVKLLTVPKNALDQVVAVTPELAVAFVKVLAERLSRGNVGIAKASDTERAYQLFISEYQTGPHRDIIGSSKIITKLRTEIELAAANDGPVLIQGPIGTEKQAVGRLLHHFSKRHAHPFLVIDLKSVRLGQAATDRDSLHFELAQESTLFGHEQGNLPFTTNRRLGLLQVGNQGTLIIENIDFLTSRLQIKLADFLEGGFFKTLGGSVPIPSAVRIVGSTVTDLAALAAKSKFNQRLYDLLSVQILKVPALKQRKRDIHALTDYLVAHFGQQAGKEIAGIDRAVYHEILAYDWPGNMEELEVVLRRAVKLARTTTLVPTDLFIGQPTSAGKITFNLLQLDRLRQLFKSRAYPGAAQVVTALFFILIMGLGFWGRQSADNNLALVLSWNLWEPMVMFSCLFAARIWCAVCPAGGLSGMLSGHWSLGLPPPHLIRQYGYYFSAAGLAAIFWAEFTFDMHNSPMATATLILTITILATLSGLLFERRVWCRYLCPLGGLVGTMASCAAVELRANQSTCNNDCTDHYCYVGREDRGGCPMYEAPFSQHSNQNCILCGTCIDLCPNQSPRLNLRLPGYELWATQKPSQVFGLLVMTLMATQLFRGLLDIDFHRHLQIGPGRQWLLFTAIMLFSFLLTQVFFRTASRSVFNRRRETSGDRMNLLAYGLVPLAVAYELGYQLEHFLARGGLLLPSLGQQLGYDWSRLGFVPGPWAAKGFQVQLLLVGFIAAIALLRHFVKSSQPESAESLKSWRCWPALLLVLVYGWFFLAT